MSVGADTDVLRRVAGGLADANDGVLRSAGQLSDAIAAYHHRCDGPRVAERGLEVASLARRWQAVATELWDQADDLMRADIGVDRALATLAAAFEHFDVGTRPGSRADGIISRADLAAVAGRDGEGDLGAAARTILDEPGLFDALDTAAANSDYLDHVEAGRFHAGTGDGRISVDDLAALARQRAVHRIIEPIASDIDVASRGGAPDGVLSRADHLAYLRSGRATDEQAAAIVMALRDGAVDGEQGVADDVADVASTVATSSGYAASALAVTSAALAATGVLAPVAAATSSVAAGLGTVSLAASVVELGAGAVAGDDEHIIGAAFSLSTAAVSAGLGATIKGATTPAGTVLTGSADEVLAGMLEGTPVSRLVADLGETAVNETGNRVAAELIEERRSAP